jgi:hypothetical protein
MLLPDLCPVEISGSGLETPQRSSEKIPLTARDASAENMAVFDVGRNTKKPAREMAGVAKV